MLLRRRGFFFHFFLSIFYFSFKVVDGALVLFRKKKDVLLAELTELGFAQNEGSYGYLLDLPMWALTFEHVEKLQKEREGKAAALQELKAKTARDLWLQDLMDLEQCWNGAYREECASMIAEGPGQRLVVVSTAAAVTDAAAVDTAAAVDAATVADVSVDTATDAAADTSAELRDSKRLRVE